MGNQTILQNGNKSDETAKIIAELFGIDDSYVRKLISNKRTPKGADAKKKAKAIIKAYWQYKNGKNNLIKAIEKTVNVI